MVILKLRKIYLVSTFDCRCKKIMCCQLLVNFYSFCSKAQNCCNIYFGDILTNFWSDWLVNTSHSLLAHKFEAWGRQSSTFRPWSLRVVWRVTKRHTEVLFCGEERGLHDVQQVTLVKGVWDTLQTILYFDTRLNNKRFSRANDFIWNKENNYNYLP